MEIARGGNTVTLLNDVIPATASGYSIDHVVAALEGEWGGFSLSTDREEEVREDFRKEFPVRVVFGSIEYFEMDNLIVRIAPLHGRIIYTSKPLLADPPACVRVSVSVSRLWYRLQAA